MQVFGKTDIGQRRETNQDVFCVKQLNDNACFAIVCDGMGGQSAGHIASDMTCEILTRHLLAHDIASADNEEARRLLIAGVSEANMTVYKASNIEPGYRGMGTTIVAVVLLGTQAHIVHIGDSRVYLLRDGQLHQITRDHSLVQELLEQGKISKEDVNTHPNKNMITRAVGVNLLVDIDYLELAMQQGNKLLLCSDGLTNMISDHVIEKTLIKHTPQQACEKLVELANKAGGADNITVAVIG